MTMTTAQLLEYHYFPNYDTKEELISLIKQRNWMQAEGAIAYVEANFDAFKENQRRLLDSINNGTIHAPRKFDLPSLMQQLNTVKDEEINIIIVGHSSIGNKPDVIAELIAKFEKANKRIAVVCIEDESEHVPFDKLLETENMPREFIIKNTHAHVEMEPKIKEHFVRELNDNTKWYNKFDGGKQKRRKY